MLSKLLPLGANRRIGIIQIAYFYSVFVAKRTSCLTCFCWLFRWCVESLGRLGKKIHFRWVIAWRSQPRNS
jgi:hypothetical protein